MSTIENQHFVFLRGQRATILGTSYILVSYYNAVLLLASYLPWYHSVPKCNYRFYSILMYKLSLYLGTEFYVVTLVGFGAR